MLILYAVIACAYGALVHLLICHCSMSLHAHAPAACACALLLQEKIEPPVYVSDRRLVEAVALMQVSAAAGALAAAAAAAAAVSDARSTPTHGDANMTPLLCRRRLLPTATAVTQ
jgi:glycerol uptake facilitator-like aquaporin